MITTALRLPAPDVEALIQGRTIVAMPQIFLNPGRSFALYPSDASILCVPIERYYRSNFLPIAQTAFTQLSSQTVSIKAWARCELCRGINDIEALTALSRLTVWTAEALQENLSQRGNIFLAYLRVYQLLHPIEVPVNLQSPFVSLQQPLSINESLPILGDQIFSQRRQQLENREPPLHPELEELQSAIAQLAITNADAKELDRDIKIFLGWNETSLVRQPKPDLAWINEIAALGNRSKQEDDDTTNYAAGTAFENIVRQSLEFLGFTVDYSHKGGAGGLDLLCLKPYPLFGECKAGKKIPNSTAVQLLNLGTIRRPDLFNEAVKLIIGPGEPLKQLKEAALVHGMAIINPETLEKLVKLQSKYPNSVDLFKLKKYLKPGQSDQEIEKYIEQVYREINLRSHIVQLVKNHLEKTGDKNAGVDALHVAYVYSNPPEKLTDKELHEILIELSSPLTGYLGRENREKGSDWQSDRFYYLRSLE